MRGQRWMLFASILGSGAVFIEGTMTNVALPAIAREFQLGIAGLQWVMNGYLLTLSALILFGGSLGDRFSRRRVFMIGLLAFAVTSLACTVAPNPATLVAARILQGMAGALVVPNSLALIQTAFGGEARGAAIGRWAAWSAVSTAIGPLVGGWLVDTISWRLIFVFAAPFAVAAVIAVRAAGPMERVTDKGAAARVDYMGAALITLGLAGVVGALILGPEAGFGSPGVLACGLGGVALLAAFIVVESRTVNPLLPPDVFRNVQFTGVNTTTLFVYAALSALFFLLMLQLQNVLGYSALVAGASLLPINGLMLLLSPYAGRVAMRRGPRVPMVVGSLVAAAGVLLFIRVEPGAQYATTVLPAAVVFGLGLACLVAPLTAVALAALGQRRAGVASGVNNAAARLAGLLAIAVVPLAAGLGGMRDLSGATLAAGFVRAMLICAGLCVAGGAVAAFTIGHAVETRNRG
jgi:EmrB/QacA subfamily drug resistance transporter